MSSHIKALLRERFSIDEWVLAFEVAPETGGGTRRADAVAMNMWRSRGHAIHGFEFKVSRGDWLRELKDPSKADAVAQYCDYWWLVIDGDNIIKDEELPEGWGLMIVVRDAKKLPKGLRVKVKAPKLKAAPINKYFMASLFRSLGKVDSVEIAALARKEADALIEARTNDMKLQITRASRDYIELNNKIEEIASLTGIQLDDWRMVPKDFAKAVQFVKACGISGAYGSIESLSKNLLEMHSKLESAMSQFQSNKTDHNQNVQEEAL